MNVLIDKVPFEVVIEDNGEHVYINEEGLSVYGLCNYSEQAIYIHRNLKEEVMKRVLIHEITHAFIYLRGMSGIKWTEETLCDFMGGVIDEIYPMANDVMKKIGGVSC